MSVDRFASGKSVKIQTVRLLTRKHLTIDENEVDILLSNLKCWTFCQLVNKVVSEMQRERDGFRYSTYQNQDNKKVNRVLNASIYHKYNRLACHVFAEYKA